VQNEEVGPAFVNFDFNRWFPQVFWVSDWKEDRSYPDGYRYKVLSVRDAEAERAEVVVVLEERSGHKVEMSRVAGPLADVRTMGSHFTEGLAIRFGLVFEEQDFSSANSQDAFDALAKQHGWAMSEPSR
jgi:hypothetical protein